MLKKFFNNKRLTEAAILACFFFITCAVNVSADDGSSENSGSLTGGSGLTVSIDKESGKFRAPTDEEKRELGLYEGLRRDTRGLREEVLENGSVRVVLKGRFMHSILAKRNPDGSLTVGEATTPAELDAFMNSSTASEKEVSDVK